MTSLERSRRQAAERSRRLGFDRFSIFVPALMSVGLLFWMVSEVTELFRSLAEEVRERRARVIANGVVDDVLARPVKVGGLRPRPVYLMIATALLATAGYVAVGSTGNFVRHGGYVSDIAWLLALACAASAIAAVYGIVSLAVFVTWPQPPVWARRVLLHSPLGTALSDGELEGRPSWRLTTAMVSTATAAAGLALVVGWSPHVVRAFDREVAGWLVRNDPLGRLTFLDPFGQTGVAIGVAMLAALAAFRCRVMASALAMAMAVALLASVTLRPLVAQSRPDPGPLAGHLESFPSGGAMLTTLFAGLLPLALAVLFDRQWVVRPLRGILAVGVLASITHQVAEGFHWPTDAIGGALIGLTLVLAAQWAIDNRQSHASCHHCPWSLDPRRDPILGVIHIHPDRHRLLRTAAHLSAAAAATGLTLLTFTVDLPADAAEYSFDRSIQTTVQIALAALVYAGALAAWRWEAVGAVLIAFAALGAGLFSAIEYSPAVATLITATISLPAVLLWLSWQHERRAHEITALAVLTAILLGGSWTGATDVYNHYFGPTHPVSTTALIPPDRVEWVWSGALHAHGVTVTARLRDGARSAQLEIEPLAGGSPKRSPALVADRDGLVRLTVDDLQPATDHAFRIVVDGRADAGRGQGRFTTPDDGPFSFTVTAGSCARTDSNGSVFDAIRLEHPLLHLAVGDLHYQNLKSTSPNVFLDAYTRALATPAQSALARAVPMAYVWDDHDYGPNDADATVPGRSAVRDAYRRAVPHYEVPPGDAAIYQAFTIGRVRFIVTDARSERTEDTMLGADQLDWFSNELETAARTHALVVWVNSVPWIGAADPASDGWAGQAAERSTIADVIAVNSIDNLVMVAGDAHMVAIDDGSNSDYSDLGASGFPVLHAAALDRPGGVKGGPYSEGAHPGSGQYGVMRVEDDGGDHVTLRLAGRNWKGETIVSYQQTFAVD